MTKSRFFSKFMVTILASVGVNSSGLAQKQTPCKEQVEQEKIRSIKEKLSKEIEKASGGKISSQGPRSEIMKNSTQDSD